MSNESLSNLKTVKQFCHDNPSFTEGGIRHIIFHRETNGFLPCIYKVGRRVLLHEQKFFACIEQQNHDAAKVQ